MKKKIMSVCLSLIIIMVSTIITGCTDGTIEKTKNIQMFGENIEVKYKKEDIEEYPNMVTKALKKTPKMPIRIYKDETNNEYRYDKQNRLRGFATKNIDTEKKTEKSAEECFNEIINDIKDVIPNLESYELKNSFKEIEKASQYEGSTQGYVFILYKEYEEGVGDGVHIELFKDGALNFLIASYSDLDRVSQEDREDFQAQIDEHMKSSDSPYMRYEEYETSHLQYYYIEGYLICDVTIDLLNYVPSDSDELVTTYVIPATFFKKQ